MFFHLLLVRLMPTSVSWVDDDVVDEHHTAFPRWVEEEEERQSDKWGRSGSNSSTFRRIRTGKRNLRIWEDDLMHPLVY